MITGYSRYANSKIERLYDASIVGPRPTIIVAEPTPKLFNYTEYAWRHDDRVDKVAYKFFNDPTLWWVIADANPEILIWVDIPPQTVIRIPSGKQLSI